MASPRFPCVSIEVYRSGITFQHEHPPVHALSLRTPLENSAIHVGGLLKQLAACFGLAITFFMLTVLTLLPTSYKPVMGMQFKR